jgi:cytochrome c-type biogenesis protein CcmF
MVALATGLLLAAFGTRQWLPLLGLMAAASAAASVLGEFIRGVGLRRKLAGERAVRALIALFQINRRRYGGYVVHFGVAILVVGLAVASNYQKEREVQLRVGESLDIGRYRLVFERLSALDGPTHVKVLAHFSVFNGHRLVGRMEPGLRFYPTQQAPIAEVDYWIGLREDLYLILGSFDREGGWVTAKALVNPMVTWLWIGGGIMALGTLLALLPESWLGVSGLKGRGVPIA